jgi:hypothetical protein
MQLGLLQFVQIREQIIGNPEKQKAAQAIGEWREQFTK